MGASRGAGHPRRKIQASLWLHAETRDALRQVARAQREPMSALVERYIRAGLAREGVAHVEEAALPQLADLLRTLAEQHDQQVEERLARLLTRALLAADTTRRLLYAHMARQWGADQIRPVHEGARTAAINALREKGWAAAIRLDPEGGLE